jgi:hypothetical protein
MSFGTPAPAAASGNPPSYPMPAHLKFCPGGIAYGEDSEASTYNLAAYSQTPGNAVGSLPSTPRSSRRGVQTPDALVHKAKIEDDRLRHYALLYSGRDPSNPYFLPSLSVLANAAFGRLTGVPPGAAKTWADAMVLQYMDDPSENFVPQREEDVHSLKPTAMKVVNDTTVNVLRRLLEEGETQHNSKDVNSATYRPRPCGYVFKRGDIAWNCRTCQTDSTCVICDSCFRQSKHDGHEVYFHRTTPGGCCDCGDAEAWRLEGCCDAHRPQMDEVVETNTDDPEEAVRMAVKGRQEGIDTLRNAPTALPPRLAAALGAVIGAAVNCLVQAVDGAGIGADPSQWKLRWTDEATRISNMAARNEDYYLSKSTVSPKAFLLPTSPQPLPQNYKLHLRLHNDDVHTFDEVIDALHEPRHSRRNTANADGTQNQSLVTLREAANDMTHHVDADGQVTVKTYVEIGLAMQGFRRLKSRGLHCAVVSTPQVDIEQRARALSTWLAEISSAHPAAAVLVVHALVQISTHHDLGGISVWHEPRTIPGWAAAGQGDDIESCRRRFQSFPPHLASSYLTGEEAEKLHEAAIGLNAAGLVELTGKQLTVV